MLKVKEKLTDMNVHVCTYVLDVCDLINITFHVNSAGRVFIVLITKKNQLNGLFDV